MKLNVWTDGTSRPKLINKKNKGKDGHSAGALVINDGERFFIRTAFYNGFVDNNQSEYLSFIKAIDYVIELNPEHVVFHTDSNLIEKQMTDKYSAHKDSIIPYYNKAKEKLMGLKSWEIKWIPREENRETDKLADDFLKQWVIENIKDI